jgi:predicted dehydrogenase
MPVKYAIVGAGSRHVMYREALAGHPVSADNQLVALCDVNEARLALSASKLPEPRGNGIALYDAGEFDRMIAEQRPDRIVVTTPDDLHDEYIVRALRAGCDVVTEKPMTIDLTRLKAILDAQRETGRAVAVTFNYRYNPAHTQLKRLLEDGVIGRVLAVDFDWHLDRVHGADYFRRWHRDKAKSGGLLVHKATHHFDLVNWWIDARPAEVVATGARRFYTPETAQRLGLAGHGPRCQGCPVRDRCSYRLDLDADPELDAMYRRAEHDDGYLRDRCIFDAEISIEDMMQVQVRYGSGVTMNYTLNAFSPWEGYNIRFYGTEGELTHRDVEVHGVFGGTGPRAEIAESRTVLHRHGAPAQEIEVWAGEGDHGGGDPVMLAYLMDRQLPPDPYRRGASERDGAWSILVGIAANASMPTGRTVKIAELLAEAGISL